MQLSDKECVERSRDGSPEDFHFLVDRYQGPLFAYVAGRVQDHLEAEEAAQESFVRAFLSLKKLRKPECFYAWLLGIAGRVIQEQFRSRKHRERACGLAQESLLTEAGPAPDYPIEQAIAALPESYRRVIVLRFYEGLSCLEVGERLGLPLGTVTKTLSRAYALLRQELEPGEGAERTVNQLNRNHELC
jgi:RNA polymerase sigma-70 factor (ECF subfamily)